MFSSFLIHERRRPPLSAGAALPTAQYHNCVVFNISVERTEHALNNILYRESPLHQNYRKAKGKFKCLKDLPSKCLGGWQPGNCTKHYVCVLYVFALYVFAPNSDPLGCEDRRETKTLNATLWERKGWTGMTPAVLAESTRVSGLSVYQQKGLDVAHSAAPGVWLISAQRGRPTVKRPGSLGRGGRLSHPPSTTPTRRRRRPTAPPPSPHSVTQKGQSLLAKQPLRFHDYRMRSRGMGPGCRLPSTATARK